MKIIIVGTAYPYRGGLAAFNERLAREYQKEGNEVEIYTFKLQYPSFLFPGKTQYSSEKPPAGLKIKRAVNSINPFNWIRTGREIKKQNPDLVIFAYWMAFMAPCFGTIARFSKLPRPQMGGLIHNMMPHEPTLLDKILPGYFVKSVGFFVAMAAPVIADINRFDKQNKPKAVSPHPVYDHYGAPVSKSEACARLHLDPEGRYMLFFGFIRKYKGLDLLLKALPDARLRGMNIKLIAAGEFYEDPAPYLKLIKDLQLEDSVVLKNEFIPDDEVKYYFSAADIVVQPYRTATQSGVSQIAYHFEKPMLVTDVGGLAETVPRGIAGYVVDPRPEEIADAAADFFENERSELYAENVKVEKKKYEWRAMTKTINKLWRRI